MAGHFEISPYFTFRWVDNDMTSPYNTLPLESQVDDLSYHQPVQCGGGGYQSDTGQIQLTSDFVPTGSLHDLDTNEFIKAIDFVPLDPPILGYDFVGYNAEIDFSDVDPGTYYGKITYNDAPKYPLTIAAALTEATTPNFIDGGLQVKFATVIPAGGDITASGSVSLDGISGQSYSFEGHCDTTPTGTANAQIITQLVKNGVMIYQKALPAISGASAIKTGILKPSAVYSAFVFTEDSVTVYPDINIADNAPVTGTDHDWRTNPLDVQIYHEGTQLFEATNFTNDKGVVFVNSDLTTLTIKKRIGSLIRSPLVKADADDYEDQYNDLTQETSIPFVVYTQLLYAANGFLLPFYEIEKINLLYSLNQILIDGQPFAKIAKSDFKPTRGDVSPQGAWWEVDVQPNFNYPNEQFITGTPPDGDFIVIKRQVTYLNKSANFAVSGIFSARKNLIRIAIVNNGGDIVTVLVGNSEDDDSFGTLVLPVDATDSIDIGRLFTVPTTVWISGIAGADLDITFDYNDYAAAVVVPPTVSSLFAKNTVYYFQEVTPGSFAVEFDVASGLGRVDTDHEGCVLAGRAGTPPMAGKVVRVWDSEEVGPSTRGTSVGSDSLTLTEAQLPAHSHFAFNGDSQNASGNDLTPGGGYARMQRNAGINRDYNISQSGTIPDRGPTSDVGEGEVIDITPSSIILPAFYYVGV